MTRSTSALVVLMIAALLGMAVPQQAQAIEAFLPPPSTGGGSGGGCQKCVADGEINGEPVYKCVVADARDGDTHTKCKAGWSYCQTGSLCMTV